MDEKFANNPFRDSLRAINKENLPKKGTQGRDAADRLKASRRHRKKADVEYDRECELFLQAMDGTGMQPDQGKDADNAFFLAEVDNFPVTATQKKGTGNKKTGKAGTEASRRTAGRTVHSATSVRPEATHVAARKETASAGSVPLQDEKDPDQEEDKSMSELLASDDTDPAFARAMQGVSPLNKSGREVIPAVASRPGPVQTGNALQDFMDGKLEFALSFTEEYIEGYVVGLDLLAVGKLRQGGYSPEASLDLHGLNVQQAFESLRGFFKSSWYRGMRCVLVVCGRGKNSPDGIGILREKIRQWFTQEPFKRVILAFCTAKAHDGGPGSVYVLLRKYKKKGRIAWDRMPPDEDLF